MAPSIFRPLWRQPRNPLPQEPALASEQGGEPSLFRLTNNMAPSSALSYKELILYQESDVRILVTGSTGFIGRALCVRLLSDGHELTLLLRRPESLPVDWSLPCQTMIWDPTHSECPHSLDGFDAVVHLMGESVATGRWTAERKEKIRRSRGLATRRLGEALARRKKPLDCFISTSAIGYYPYDAAQPLANPGLTEQAAPGAHFLSEVCQEWEQAALAVPATRHVILRAGMVIGPNGGAMERLRPLFAAGLGGKLGNGRQFMSWVHRDDLISMYSTALRDENWQGVYNAVSPEAVTNREFTQTLARVLRRPAVFHVPAVMPRLLFGEMSDLLLKSQKILPQRLQQQGFVFRFPRLEAALDDACSLFRLESHQFVERPVSEVFAFFCDPQNLERITPSNLNFRIEKMSSPKIQAGTVIHYRLRLYGVPFRWKTLIKEWEPGRYFVDTQEAGPYAVWRHAHFFQDVAGGTLLSDEVRYQLPLGWLGEAFASRLVRREVKNIFQFRHCMILRAFPPRPS